MIYRHYKGGEYRVVGLATADNGEVQIIYEPLEAAGIWYVRSLQSFHEDIETDAAGVIPRFTRVKALPQAQDEGISSNLEVIARQWREREIDSEEAWQKTRGLLRVGHE